jgi:3-oxoacyl-[acyl-carrier protein] reductase
MTGGSRGLGATIVQSLLQAGYRVATCSRQRSDLITAIEADPERGADFLWQACTIGEANEADAYVKAVVNWCGAENLWGLVNNAGIAMAGILATFPNVDIERILKVNLIGSIQMARAFSQYMIRSDRGGRVINISSIIGSRGFNGLSAYSASKAGLDGFSRALARELGRRRVTVNSVAPGYIRTDMSSILTEDQLGQIVNRTPLGRLATADDVVGVIRFLLSDDAAMITGQTIVVDGGATV